MTEIKAITPLLLQSSYPPAFADPALASGRLQRRQDGRKLALLLAEGNVRSQCSVRQIVGHEKHQGLAVHGTVGHPLPVKLPFEESSMEHEKTPIQIDGFNLSIEFLLVLALTQTSINCEASKTVENLRKKITDWNYVWSFAKKQGVLPFLVNNLNRTIPGMVSETVLTDVKRSASQNLFLLIRLREVTSLFAAHGIRAISYKGPTLSGIVYTSRALRMSGDLDFLVHPRDYTAVKTLLVNDGYQLRINCGYKYHFSHRTKQIDVDVHRKLVPRWYRFEFNFDHAWERCIQFALPFGGSVRTFCFEDLLIVLCLDLVKDVAQPYNLRLIKITDIAQLLTYTKSIDWDATMRKIKYMGLSRVLCFGLLLADRLYGITLPPDVRQKLESYALLLPLSNLTTKMIFHDQPVIVPRVFHELKTIFILHDGAKNKILVIFYYLIRFASFSLKCLFAAAEKAILRGF